MATVSGGSSLGPTRWHRASREVVSGLRQNHFLAIVIVPIGPEFSPRPCQLCWFVVFCRPNNVREQRVDRFWDIDTVYSTSSFIYYNHSTNIYTVIKTTMGAYFKIRGKLGFITYPLWREGYSSVFPWWYDVAKTSLIGERLYFFFSCTLYICIPWHCLMVTRRSYYTLTQ